MKGLLSVLMLVLLVGCNEKPVTNNGKFLEQSTGLDVTIDISAGKGWADTGTYIPAPANVGSLNGHSILVLSDAVVEGSTINVIPLAVAKLKEQGKVNHYIVSIPTDVTQRTNGINDFSDFTTSYSSAKWIIEQYIVSRNGLGQASLIGWEDAEYVKNNLLPVEK